MLLSESGCLINPVRRRSASPIRLPASGKNLAWRALELGVMFFVVVSIALLLASRGADIHTQNVGFYAVNAALLGVVAYPGFVYRYLRRRGATEE